MDIKLEILRKTRLNFLQVIADLTIDQLNKIPPGFNNNIVWQLGHLIVTQQSLCYLRAGVKMTIDEQAFLNYKPESKPNGFIEMAEVEKMKGVFIAAIDRFSEDYSNNVFASYTPWTNRYKIELKNIDDAIAYVLYHEGIHLGAVMALKKQVEI